MHGKIVLITGATSGIGKCTAIELAKKGATVVITARNVERGKQVLDEIKSISGHEAHLIECDLSSLLSVKASVQQFKSKFDKLDVLINNAGIWNPAFRLGKDGIEETFTVNVLAPYLLTTLLTDWLQRAGKARVITTSSALHFGNINFDDLEYKRKFSGFHAYRQSKLAVNMITRFLARELESKGIIVNCMHPGVVATNLGRNSGWLMDSTTSNPRILH